MYVSDSLFFIQHMFTDKENDENFGIIFTKKLRDIYKEQEELKNNIIHDQPVETAEDIKNRMIAKSEKLSGTKL